MNLKIGTTQNIYINYRICSLGERILAYLIDAAVIGGIMIGIGVVLIPLFSIGSSVYKFFIVFYIPVFFYHLICEMVMDGQSIGKRARNIRVIRADGSPGSFSSYFIRFLLRPIDSIYAVGLAFIFFTEKGQRLGDLAAGTVVVSVEENLSIYDIHSPAFRDISKITYPEVSNLKDKDITLIKRVLKQRKTEPHHENVQLLARKIKTMLNVSSGQSDYTFLETIINDFHTYYEK